MKQLTLMEPSNQLYKLNLEAANLRSAFCGYLNAGLFTDCTIVGNCGRSLNVHKVILSACSDYLAKLFLLRNSDINPIIVFPEIAFEDLRRIVEYIYIGELTIDEESLDGFMFAAELFQIKGVLVGTPFQAQISNQRNSIESDDSTSSNDSTSCSPSSDDSNERNLSPAPTTKIRKKIPPAKRPVTTQKARKLPQKLPKANTTDDPEIFQCSYCLKFFKNARIQKQHFQSHCILNPNRKTFQCSTCSRIFQRKCRLTAHEKLHKVVDDK